jgi:uncharacterized protein (TIGR02266 family)
MAKVSVELHGSGEEAAGSTAERRRSQRADLLVRVDYATVDELFSEFTRDVNAGGLFIETEKPRPAGTVVSMHFNLPGSDEPIQTQGRVVRISPGGGDGPPGMGIEFDHLSKEARARIDALIRTLRIGHKP